jgi:O-acetyl-ADP-ribose deacetylase (regulator of RNase III)
VSPANSFGFLDGGIDTRYSERWGWVFRKAAKTNCGKASGELVVGAAEIVETGDLTKPYLIAAPTMRLPMILGPETVNPYLTIRAVLLLIEHEVSPKGDKRAPK